MRTLAVVVLAVLLVVASAAPDGSLGAAQLHSDLSGQSLRLDSLLSSIEPKMQALYELCRIDAVCASRFYLTDSASLDPGAGNDATRRLQASDVASDQKKFSRELVAWAQQDDCPLRGNSLRGRLTLSDYHPDDAAWWLTMMTTARICGDNQVWETGQGCVMKPDRVDEDGDPVHAKTQLDSIGQPLAVLTVMVVIILIETTIVGATYILNRNFTTLTKYIDGSKELWTGAAPRDTSALKHAPLVLTHQDYVGGDMETSDVVAHVGRHY